jgi:alkyl hydroperoxide reductase subunit AhpC
MAQRFAGLPAPAFEMETPLGNGKDFGKVSLNDFKGKWLVLFFYPLDITFVCPTEITALCQIN